MTHEVDRSKSGEAGLPEAMLIHSGILYGILLGSGLFSGLLAGLLGIGGGTVLVPLLVALHYSPLQAVATSSLAIAVTSSSGTWQNWRMGYLDWQRVLGLGIPALVTAQLGVYLADRLPASALLYGFGSLLILNILLVQLRHQLEKREKTSCREPQPTLDPENPTALAPPSPGVYLWTVRLGTGGAAGLLAGLFGVGGGVIMVPLQMLLLQEPIKLAIQTSLGVIVLTAIAAVVGHSIAGNVLYLSGLLLGLGGLIGAQISTRCLPKLPETVVTFLFNALLALLTVYSFWQASQY
ncbi:MAG: sulfite exporter TauE/SafE family protein [Merismopediaceae bacterium]|nr:sulfite exporter TauE/SafE family protein [Merismopediaceae bacterium]